MTIDTKKLSELLREGPYLYPGASTLGFMRDAANVLDAQAAEIERLREALRKAVQLTEICTDWNLDEVEIDGEMVRTRELGVEFRAALAQEPGESDGNRRVLGKS